MFGKTIKGTSREQAAAIRAYTVACEAMKDARERLAALEGKKKNRLEAVALAVLSAGNIALLPFTWPPFAAGTVLLLGVAAMVWPLADFFAAVFE